MMINKRSATLILLLVNVRDYFFIMLNWVNRHDTTSTKTIILFYIVCVKGFDNLILITLLDKVIFIPTSSK